MNKLQVDVWDINGSGQVTRQGKATAGAVTSAAANSKIAIGRFDDDDFFTASINEDRKLELIRWTVNNAGELTKGAEGVVDIEITEVAVSGGATVMRLKDDGTFKLINWRIVADKFARRGEASSSHKLTHLAAAGNVLSAARLEGGALHLIKWKIID